VDKKNKQMANKLSMHAGAKPELFRFAEKLRLEMTEAEIKLWSFLAENPAGLKFRRQHPFHTYIFDFYCHKAKLAIEIDGGYHQIPKQKILDKERKATMAAMGISELRFTNEEVMQDFGFVTVAILNQCNNILTSQLLE
jgi:very-short-patch-repair endonuclease